MILSEFNHGHSFENASVLCFFGNKFLNKDALFSLFPYPFSELKQNHGDTLISPSPMMPSFSDLPTADAQYTTSPGLGLLIKTADCMPIFIFDKSCKKILAIHAGWRGIENQITIKSIQKLFPESEELTLIIGPYIHQNSFEVDADVKDLLLSRVNINERKPCYLLNEKNKYLIDLKMILLNNLKTQFKKTRFNFFDLQINTFTDLRYNSFRRDKDKNHRNYSFILIK